MQSKDIQPQGISCEVQRFLCPTLTYIDFLLKESDGRDTGVRRRSAKEAVWEAIVYRWSLTLTPQREYQSTLLNPTDSNPTTSWQCAESNKIQQHKQKDLWFQAHSHWLTEALDLVALSRIRVRFPLVQSKNKGSFACCLFRNIDNGVGSGCTEQGHAFI